MGLHGVIGPSRLDVGTRRVYPSQLWTHGKSSGNGGQPPDSGGNPGEKCCLLNVLERQATPVATIRAGFTRGAFVPMMPPAMATPSDERLAYAPLARQGVHVRRFLPAVALTRLGELATGLGEVEVDLEFRTDESGRPWVHGRASQRVEATCQRCVERIQYDLAVDFDLCIQRESAAARELAERVDVLMVGGDSVTVAEIVEDELLLGLPERLCTEEPCPFAPALAYPVGAEEPADTTSGQGGPFDILAKLKRADS